MPQRSGRVPLSGEKLDEYLKARESLLSLLEDDDSDCSKYLKKTLGVTGSRVARTVRNQRPFNGDASTLSLEDAGILPRNSVTSEEGIVISSKMPVNEFFALRVAIAASAGFARRSTGADARDVYFAPVIFTEEEILHESLHILLGASDADLKKRKGDLGALAAAGCNSLGHAYRELK